MTAYEYVGMWLSLVEYFVRDEGAAGSNPVIPTNKALQVCKAFFLLQSRCINGIINKRDYAQ